MYMMKITFSFSCNKNKLRLIRTYYELKTQQSLLFYFIKKYSDLRRTGEKDMKLIGAVQVLYASVGVKRKNYANWTNKMHLFRLLSNLAYLEFGD